MMSQKDEGFYNRLRKNEWKNTADFGPGTTERYRVLLKLAKKYGKKTDRVLDCGCGTGNFLRHLNRYFEVVLGSDFSDEALVLARQKVDCPISKCDLTNLNDFCDQKYDVIVCSEILEHIDHDKLAMSNLKKALRSGGIVIISVPCGMKFWSRHDDFSGHVRRYEGSELDEKMTAEGFTILESFGWGSVIYPIYHRLLTAVEPSKVMGQHAGWKTVIKRVVSGILRVLFSVEALDRSMRRARRQFIVARND